MTHCGPNIALTVAVATLVLARASFRDDAGLAHALRQQNLADGVVDFMRAGVEQILALEINLRAAQFAREAFGVIQGRGASAKFAEIIPQFAAGILGRFSGAEIFLLQLLQRVHQSLRYITASVRAEMSLHVRHGRTGDGTTRRMGR